MYIRNKWEIEIIGHLPTHKEIEIKETLKCPLRPPVFSDLTSLTRHYTQKDALNRETIIWPDIWRQVIKINKFSPYYTETRQELKNII